MFSVLLNPLSTFIDSPLCPGTLTFVSDINRLSGSRGAWPIEVYSRSLKDRRRVRPVNLLPYLPLWRSLRLTLALYWRPQTLSGDSLHPPPAALQLIIATFRPRHGNASPCYQPQGTAPSLLPFPQLCPHLVLSLNSPHITLVSCQGSDSYIPTWHLPLEFCSYPKHAMSETALGLAAYLSFSPRSAVSVKISISRPGAQSRCLGVARDFSICTHPCLHLICH